MPHLESGFEIYWPQLVALRRANQHGSRIFNAHHNKYGMLVIDTCVEKILSWEFYTTRKNIGKIGVRHLALIPYVTEYGTRLIGVPVDKSDRPLQKSPQLDIRMPVDSQTVEPSLPQRALDVVPDWLARDTKHGLEVKFELPGDLLERVGSIPMQTLLPN